MQYYILSIIRIYHIRIFFGIYNYIPFILGKNNRTLYYTIYTNSNLEMINLDSFNK